MQILVDFAKPLTLRSKFATARRKPRPLKGGTTTLEFALLSFPFLLYLLFLLELGFDFYLQLALDYAVYNGARAVQTGAAQTTVTSAAFLTNYMCPSVAGLLNCSQIAVNVTPISSDYYSQNIVAVPTTNGKYDPTGWSFCPGTPNALMLVQATYSSVSIVGALLPSMSYPYGSTRVRVTSSSTAFINELFTGPDSAGC